MKTRVHIIHHTHWDMEWYFTSHDTNALLNYSLKNIMNNLNKKDETFLFDGQVAPFEDISKNTIFFKEFKKLVRSNKLKIGPWYSQPDLRLTSDEGIFRNYHYGQNLADLKTNEYSYLYTPDTFGFGENIPAIYNTMKKKYAILWRGVNRHKLNNAPIFKWEVENNDQSTIVYNIASGYFVGRYLYADKSLDALYKNNILPSIKYQTANGKYSVAAIPSGGDQQPYNENLVEAIKKLNEKNDGNHYLLSTWEDFLKELEPQIKDIPTYKGSHVHAYGGRLHKLVGAHRPDIKKLLYRNEMLASRVLEPFLLMTSIGIKMYPELEMDKMWKNILLSQAHDAYASCNSDIVNKNIKNRLLDSYNIYKSNKDLLIRLISNNYKDNSIIIFNPTQYEGEKLFKLEVATNSKFFEIKNKNENIDYIIESQRISKGGVKVTYTANGEQEKELPEFYISKIKLKTHVAKTTIKELQCIELKNKKEIKNQNHNFVDFLKGKFFISDGTINTKMDINFHLDGGDGYDLDLYDEIKPFNLSDANVKKVQENFSQNIIQTKYNFDIKIPKNINSWLGNKKDEILKGEIIFTLSNKIKVEYKFNNLQPNLLIQATFEKKHPKNEHVVLTQNGYIKRQNKMIVEDEEISKLREKPSDFDLMHGNVIIGGENKLSIFSLDAREYKIDNNKIFFNLIRTPDVLGRSNLRIRPGRQSGLSDKTVYIPNSTKDLNGQSLELNIGFNLSESELSHLVDYMVIDDLAIHKQPLYKYYGNVNGWTLPNIKTDKYLKNKIVISNNKIVLLAFFRSREEYFVRLNNPTNEIIETSLEVFEKTYKNIKIKSNETKQIRFNK